MIVVMKQSSSEEDVEKVKEKAIQQGHEPLVIYGVERNVVAVSGKVNDDHRAVMKLQLLLVQIVLKHKNRQSKLQWLQRKQDQMV